VFKWKQNSANTGFASQSRIDTAWMRCATVAVGKPEQQVCKASLCGSKQQWRSILLSPLVSTISCSLALQALLEVTHEDQPISINLLLLVRTTYIWVILFAHILFMVNRTFNATQPWGCNITLGTVSAMLPNRKFNISCKLDISCNLSRLLFRVKLH